MRSILAFRPPPAPRVPSGLRSRQTAVCKVPYMVPSADSKKASRRHPRRDRSTRVILASQNKNPATEGTRRHQHHLNLDDAGQRHNRDETETQRSHRQTPGQTAVEETAETDPYQRHTPNTELDTRAAKPESCYGTAHTKVWSWTRAHTAHTHTKEAGAPKVSALATEVQ